MAFIIIFNIILYAVLLVWTYKNMYALANKTKIIYLTCMIIFLFIITVVVYNVGGNPINKGFGSAASTFNRTMQSLFIGVNGLIIIPYIASVLNKYKEKIIDESGVKKRIIVIAIIFIAFLIFEFNYIKDMQMNMLEMINNK